MPRVLADRSFMVTSNVPLFATSEVMSPPWIETALPPLRNELPVTVAVPETLPKKKAGEPSVVAVLPLMEIPPSTPDSAVKLEPPPLQSKAGAVDEASDG